MHAPHKYSLVFDDKESANDSASLDIEADGPQAALTCAEQRAPGRSFELFEDGHDLCHVHQSPKAYWTIEPARAAKQKA